MGSFVIGLKGEVSASLGLALSSAHSVADLSVDERNVHVFAFRSQLAYALDARPVSNSNLHMALRFGADAAFADGDTVEAALLGQALNFNVSTDDTVRGFGGVDMSYLSDGGSRFFLGAEAGYDSGDALTLEVAGWLQAPL